MTRRDLTQGGEAAASGSLAVRVIRAGAPDSPAPATTVAGLIRSGLPARGLDAEINRWRLANRRNLFRGARRVAMARALHLPHFFGKLDLKVIRASGDEVDLGLASLRVVTTTGVNFMVDAFQNLVELEIMKFHALGTGVLAEASGDTGLGTELGAQYNPDNTRATGSLAEGASANIYRTVGTNTVDGAAAVTEHGILSQAATGGGVLLDRSVFAAVNLANGDSLQTTYDFTIAAGG